jgi:peptidoglycan/LPS O-acetylase OafA/YrhL
MADVVWSIAVGMLAIGGIVVCASYQEDIHSPGMRLMLIAAAISLGLGGGLLADRLTSSRRSSRRSGANRKTRRHIRSVAFAITGIVIASCIVALYIAHQVGIIVGAAVAVLIATWLWYVLESRSLSRGTDARHLRDRDD